VLIAHRIALEQTLAERAGTHGAFEENSRIAQALKETMRACAGWERLTPAMRESLEMDCHKVGRILAGDPDFRDHWQDLAGYAQLIARECSK
jgi:hypothetical protein